DCERNIKAEQPFHDRSHFRILSSADDCMRPMILYLSLFSILEPPQRAAKCIDSARRRHRMAKAHPYHIEGRAGAAASNADGPVAPANSLLLPILQGLLSLWRRFIAIFDVISGAYGCTARE